MYDKNTEAGRSNLMNLEYWVRYHQKKIHKMFVYFVEKDKEK